MRAFLSHSSVDKDIVIEVHESLEPQSTWLDRAEIEWGDLFLEKIAEGVEAATDFVLFWSRAAKKSEWVRLEVNMAFIQALRSKAIRLRVVVLDDTPLPLYLKPFHVFSVIGSKTPAKDILEKLTSLLREPSRSARSKFVNRHDEFERIEAGIDDPEVHAICAFGFTGIGKLSVIQEAIKRTFEGADVIHIDVASGTGFVELALALNARARQEVLPEGLSKEQLEGEIRLSIETLARDQRILLISNVQHWLDEDSRPQGPLITLLGLFQGLQAFSERPVYLTSTRRPALGASSQRVSLIHVGALADEHVATLVRQWYFSIFGKELSIVDAKRIAPKLYGHPVAARLVAGLLENHSVDFLENYPREIVALRRDLARTLLQDIVLAPAAERLMETLALANGALPASIIVATGFSDDEFQQAIAQCTSAGLLTADVVIETHPLFREFFWHRLHRGHYREPALKLAESITTYLNGVDKTSVQFITLLPVAFRSFALAGELGKATALRRDLSGELEATAVTLYNRRNYPLADQYIAYVLDGDPTNWRMRLYRARVRIRQEKWSETDAILSTMLDERPGDTGVLHATGWRQLRHGNLKEALDIFTGIIAKREHVASLRDAAECLHRLHRNDEALKFLERARARESENPFVLDLESRIFEEQGKLQPAYESGLLASARDPLNAHLHNRLGVIRTKQAKPELALEHFEKAVALDPDLFSAANSLASAYVEVGKVDLAQRLLPELEKKARTPSDSSLLEHTRARVAFAQKDFKRSLEILKKEIAANRNLVPSLGLLVQVECAVFDENRTKYPALATAALKSAEDALARITEIDASNRFIEKLRTGVSERRRRS